MQYAVCQPAAKTSKLEDHFFFGHPLPTHVFTGTLHIQGPLLQPASSWSAMAWLRGTLVVVHKTHKFWANNPIILWFVTTRYDSPYVIVFTFQLHIHAISVEHFGLVLCSIKPISIIFKTAFLTPQETLHLEVTFLRAIKCSVTDSFPCVSETSEQTYHTTR